MKKANLILVILICILQFACKQDKQKADAKAIISEWVGKTIRFPDKIPCQSLGKDTTCINPQHPTYKILLYVDSAGCSSCKLKLSNWKQLIDEVDSLFPEKVDFLFFFQPKTRDLLNELAYLFKRDDFRYPIYIDLENRINQINQFPDKMEYQCFLLDQESKVILIGNPTLNPKIWELYKQQISGKIQSTSTPTTAIEVNSTRLELSQMNVGETYTCAFEIKNTGNYPLAISGINSTCGCTVPTWDKRPIAPEGTTTIRVEVKPESSGFFNKTIDVYGNMEQSPLKLTIIGSVE